MNFQCARGIVHASLYPVYARLKKLAMYVKRCRRILQLQLVSSSDHLLLWLKAGDKEIPRGHHRSLERGHAVVANK